MQSALCGGVSRFFLQKRLLNFANRRYYEITLPKMVMKCNNKMSSRVEESKGADS